MCSLHLVNCDSLLTVPSPRMQTSWGYPNTPCMHLDTLQDQHAQLADGETS